MAVKHLAAQAVRILHQVPGGQSVARIGSESLSVAMTPLHRLPPGSLLSPTAPAQAGDPRPEWLLPVVLVIALGEPADTVLADTVARLRRVAIPRAGVRPVLVTDGAGLQIARRAGIPVDHLVPSRSWQRRHTEPYQRYLARRLTGLRRDYGTRHLVSVPAGGWAEDDAALAVLHAFRTDAPPGRWRRGLLRLQRTLDPA